MVHVAQLLRYGFGFVEIHVGDGDEAAALRSEPQRNSLAEALSGSGNDGGSIFKSSHGSPWAAQMPAHIALRSRKLTFRAMVRVLCFRRPWSTPARRSSRRRRPVRAA